MKENQPLWFKYFCNFQDNLKLRDLNDGYFETGLAVYCCVKEKLMVSATGALSFDDLIKLLRFNYRWQCPEKLPEIVTRCIQLGLLDKDKDGFVSSKEIYECREKVEKGKRDGSKGGSTSAENRAGGYNQYSFILQDETIWKMPNTFLNELRAKYNNVDELLMEYQDISKNDKKQRDTRRHIKEHIEAYIIQNEHKIPF